MEARHAPYPDYVPLHAAFNSLIEQPWPFLRLKKAEFLLNAVWNFPRAMPCDPFFEDLAALVPDAGEARRLCAGAFAADGRDENGRLPRQLTLPVEDWDDMDDEEREEAFAASERSQRTSSGPFDGRSIGKGLKTVWRETHGLMSLRTALREVVSQHVETLRATAPARDPARTRFAELRRTTGLTAFETDLLVYLFLVREANCRWASEGGEDDDPGERFRGPHQMIAFSKIAAACLDVSHDRVRAALAPEAPLARFGWVDPRDLSLAHSLSLYLGGFAKTPLRELFYRPLEGRALPWDYFGADVRALGECAEALVRARRGGEGGVNLLLHGAAGTGKSSFALSLAGRLGMRAVSIAFSEPADRPYRNESAGGSDAQADFRFGALGIADRNCRPAKDLIVVDEADTLLAHAGTNRLNDALDGSKCVRLWITNLEPGDLPASNLRRFDLAIPFEPLGPRQRAEIWRNSIARNGLDGVFSDADVEDFSERYAVSAGGISRVCANLAAMRGAEKAGAKRRGGGEAAEAAHRDAVRLARTLVENHARLLSVPFRKTEDADAVSRGYVLEGLAIRGDVPPADVVSAARRHLGRLEADDRGNAAEGVDEPRFNLLLSGPPGCGKTEFVRYLGERLGREVRTLGASDLLDCYVGETEKRIRRAFDDAARDGAVLFFDEIDSVLRSRAGAHRSWEVSQVNEILARMEGFRGVFVAATNFRSSLDPAVMRRFPFKLSFGYLDREGKRAFFERFFRTALSPAEEEELAAIPRLCPGDFRTVRQSLWYLPGGSDNARRLAALRAESEQKGRSGEAFDDAERTPMGFGR